MRLPLHICGACVLCMLIWLVVERSSHSCRRPKLPCPHLTDPHLAPCPHLTDPHYAIFVPPTTIDPRRCAPSRMQCLGRSSLWLMATHRSSGTVQTSPNGSVEATRHQVGQRSHRCSRSCVPCHMRVCVSVSVSVSASASVSVSVSVCLCVCVCRVHSHTHTHTLSPLQRQH
jgi:hypothetical protein